MAGSAILRGKSIYELFFSRSLVNFGCFGNLKFPLTYMGKIEKHLLLCHCRYFDKTFTEMFLE